MAVALLVLFARWAQISPAFVLVFMGINLLLALSAARIRAETGIPRTDFFIIYPSAVMVGLGETAAEVAEVLSDLRDTGVSIVAIGQYLCPSGDHLSVAEYITPDQFASYRDMATEMGFAAAVCGPLVRSSYHAAEAARLACSR